MCSHLQGEQSEKHRTFPCTRDFFLVRSGRRVIHECIPHQEQGLLLLLDFLRRDGQKHFFELLQIAPIHEIAELCPVQYIRERRMRYIRGQHRNATGKDRFRQSRRPPGSPEYMEAEDTVVKESRVLQTTAHTFQLHFIVQPRKESAGHDCKTSSFAHIIFHLPCEEHSVRSFPRRLDAVRTSEHIQKGHITAHIRWDDDVLVWKIGQGVVVSHGAQNY